MSKHYKIFDNRIIDLEKYEITLRGQAIDFEYKADSRNNFYIKFESKQDAETEFEKMCETLTEKKKELLFYEVDDDTIVNLREVKAIAMSNVIGDVDYIYFEFGEEWSYKKAFSADDRDLAANELRRLKKLLIK